jgi:hypothetical protein
MIISDKEVGKMLSHQIRVASVSCGFDGDAQFHNLQLNQKYKKTERERESVLGGGGGRETKRHHNECCKGFVKRQRRVRKCQESGLNNP